MRVKPRGAFNKYCIHSKKRYFILNSKGAAYLSAIVFKGIVSSCRLHCIRFLLPRNFNTLDTSIVKPAQIWRYKFTSLFMIYFYECSLTCYVTLILHGFPVYLVDIITRITLTGISAEEILAIVILITVNKTIKNKYYEYKCF